MKQWTMLLIPCCLTYRQIVVTKDAHAVTLQYTDAFNSNMSFSARLMDYVTNKKARHLTIVSSDGYTFIISPEKSFTAVIIAINKVSQNEPSGQTIHLGRNQEYDEVRTVYGAKLHANNITGNDKPNTIVGGDGDDFLNGEGGNDILKGGGGNNGLTGGQGNDTLSGGSGNDVLDGGPGNDILSPGGGDNFVDGGDEAEMIHSSMLENHSMKLVSTLTSIMGFASTDMDMMQSIRWRMSMVHLTMIL